MSDPIRSLFLASSTLKIKSVLAASDLELDLSVTCKRGKYSGTFSRGKSTVKHSLEKIDDQNFFRSLLYRYYFGETDKKYGSARVFMARLGAHAKKPIPLESTSQSYKAKYRAEFDSVMKEVQMSLSPLSNRLIVRANRV